MGSKMGSIGFDKFGNQTQSNSLFDVDIVVKKKLNVPLKFVMGSLRRVNPQRFDHCDDAYRCRKEYRQC